MPKVELVEKRTRNSKTHYLGGRKYSWDGIIGAIHYKDNSKDEAEQWKNIDTTISADGRVRKAPYDLDVYLEGMPGFHYKSKESGEFDIRLRCARQVVRRSPERILELKPIIPKPRIEGNKVIWENIYPDTDVVLKASKTCVSLKRILKSNKAPLEYDVDIQEIEGIAKLRPLRPATDTNGQQLVMEERAITSGRTEKLKLEVLPEEGIEPQPIAFPIEDSTEVNEVVPDGKSDALEKGDGTFEPDQAHPLMVSCLDSDSIRCLGTHFTTIDVPKASTIDAAYQELYCYSATPRDMRCKIYGNNIDSAKNFDTAPTGDPHIIDRARTDGTGVDGDGYASWVAAELPASTWVGSNIEIKNVIQEIVNRGGWAANNSLALLYIADIGEGYVMCYTYSYDEDPQYAPKLHIEYTEAAAGWSHKYLGVANASIAKICGVAIADIKKVNGVE